MSYTPTTWRTGDTVTAQKMNKLENGVGDLSSEKISAPLNPSDGQFLVYSSEQSAWVAQTLATWQGGNY